MAGEPWGSCSGKCAPLGNGGEDGAEMGTEQSSLKMGCVGRAHAVWVLPQVSRPGVQAVRPQCLRPSLRWALL